MLAEEFLQLAFAIIQFVTRVSVLVLDRRRAHELFFELTNLVTECVFAHARSLYRVSLGFHPHSQRRELFDGFFQFAAK